MFPKIPPKTAVLSMPFLLSALACYGTTNSTNMELLLLGAVAVWIPTISESLSRKLLPNYKRKASGLFTLLLLFMLIAFYNYTHGNSLNVLVWRIIAAVVFIMWIFISR
ncbi:hypothetical protein DRN44_03935 [Thermococci archaeon]|nr:MAG: hypothetical protein DRN44_03935 [Thermococci archaeon]